jgi:6-phosphogluconolactonase
LSFKFFRELACWSGYAALALVTTATAADRTVFVGTYTGSQSKGIYAFHFDSVTGKLTNASLAVESSNPSFLAVHPNGRFLFAANENPNGAVSAFKIESARLTLKNSVPSRGAGPCHISLDRTGRWLFAANYDSGSAAAFPIREDGSLGEASGFVQHRGSSVDHERQEGPHAHMAVASPDNRFVLVPDLGLDRVLVYAFDAVHGTLTEAGAGKLAPGSGPRHLVFSPNGQFVYVLNEITATIDTFRWEKSHGVMEPAGNAPMLPVEYKGPRGAAEIAIDSSGRFLYASNRGDNSIALFRINGRKLTPTGHAGTGGKTPRNFTLDPDGNFLLAANQNSGTIVEFRIDKTTGSLTPTGEQLAIPAPVSIAFSDLTQR